MVFCSKIVTKLYRKVLVLGLGDSGKSTVLKVCVQSIESTWRNVLGLTFLQQMQLIHHIPFLLQEVESFRQWQWQQHLFGSSVLLSSLNEHPDGHIDNLTLPPATPATAPDES